MLLKLSIPWSAKKKHKVFAVYFSVANLPAHVQSNTDQMSLVLLRAENNIKQFESSEVFPEMLVDLKDFEENGTTTDGKKGRCFVLLGII